MHSVQTLLRAVTSILLLTIVACSSSDETSGDPNQDEQMERATALCTRRCDKEVATRCEATPPDRRSTCIASCTEKYTDHPDCNSSLVTLDSCRAVGGSYTCDAAGAPLLGPAGLCEAELQACLACTGGSADGCG
jgi:hypothetical protein